MRIGILRIGETNAGIISGIKENLTKVFVYATCFLIEETVPLRNDAFDETRGQYKSHAILNEVHSFVARKEGLNRVLGVVDADIFGPKLSFVFGEATCPGKAALISLWRLKPEFYGDAPNELLFLERTLKEAVHELGHTLGLEHCPQSLCVMHFSNSILDTDAKQELFCKDCHLQATISIERLRQQL